ncbi:hypothetical protein ACJA3G_03450 [Streptomyces sp. YS-3]
MSARIDSGVFTGEITTATRHLDLSSVRSVYWRRPTPFRNSQQVEAPEQRFVIEQSRHGYMGALHALPGALYVNHPARNREAENKVLQLATAARLGFTVPDTLITDVPADAAEFVAEHGTVIYKPVHRVHLTGEDGRNRTVWVRTVRTDEPDDSIALCPHVFQDCVPKIADVRLAMVGDQAFATRIDTDGDHLDWRQDQSLITCSPSPSPMPCAPLHGPSFIRSDSVSALLTSPWTRTADGGSWNATPTGNGRSSTRPPPAPSRARSPTSLRRATPHDPGNRSRAAPSARRATRRR